MFDRTRWSSPSTTPNAANPRPRKKAADPSLSAKAIASIAASASQVCPTGIDIRNGMQYECIGCAACIDACDQVMER